MKHFLILLIILSFSFDAFAQRRVRVERSKLALTVTHLLPSSLVLPGGTLMLGTVAGLGLFDIFDITTNLYLDIEQVLNVNFKANLFHNEDYSLALFTSVVSQTVRYSRFNVSLNSTEQLSQASTAVFPGAVFSYRILPQLIGHIGGRLAIRSPQLTKADLGTTRTALVQGNTINKEFSYAINQVVAVSLGGTYDLSYDVAGVGASIHVGGFQIGAHYYLNVTEGAVLPIIGGGYTSKLD